MAVSTGDDTAFGDMTLLTRGFQISRMVQVAASLGLADRLAEGPLHVSDLALDSGADPAALLRLCRALAAFGVFAVDTDDVVSQSPRSEGLRRDAVPSLYHAARYWGSPAIWAAWSELEHTVRTGESAFEAVHGMSTFDYLRCHPEQAALFDLFMQNSPDDRHAATAAAVDLSGVSLVVDVGGGNGALLASLLQRNPRVSGLLFDQAEVVAGAAHALDTFPGRLAAASGSFFDAVPAGGDVYVLSQVLHDWDDDDCRRILTNVRTAMGHGRRLVLVERLLGKDSGPLHYLSDINMMVNLHGRERTLAQFTDLLATTGFDVSRVSDTGTAFSILESVSV